MADPADFRFIPHPEWYFLWLFQLMKLGGAVGEMGAPVVLMLVVGFLVLLPFIDPLRSGKSLPRAWVLASVAAGLAGMAALTGLAVHELPEATDPRSWSAIAIAGHDIAARPGCAKCHGPDSVAPDLMRGRVARSDAWIRNHMSDPNTMAPGIRAIPFDAPTAAETTAVLAYLRKVRLGAPVPVVPEAERKIAIQYARACAGCHTIDGDGISDGPDLTHAGRVRDAVWIAKKIVYPTAEDPKARMPSLADKMTADQVRVMAEFLARRK
jgi:mono/diheme cytochrome c family protein